MGKTISNPTGVMRSLAIWALAGVAAGLASGLAFGQVAAPEPVITTQPQSRTVDPGTTVTFSLVASGAEPLSYAWSQDGILISEDPLCIIQSADESHEGVYQCVVSNTYGQALSNPASLNVNDPPLIVSGPESLIRAVGTSARFTVSASGTPPLTYAWYKSPAELPLKEGLDNFFQISAVAENDAGTYYCAVFNSAGTVVSKQATLTVGYPPAIQSGPEPVTVAPGQNATFSVVATGTPPLTYAWFRGSEQIATGPDNSVTIQEAVEADEASYYCAVSSPFGNVASPPALLTVIDPPRLMEQTVSIMCAVGVDATFHVTAEGVEPIYYEWHKVGNPSPLAQSSEFTIPSAQVSDSGTYWCRVWNIGGEVRSIDMLLTVVIPPTILTNLTPQTVTLGDSVMFTIVAAGNEPLQYEWYKNGTLLVSCECPSYMISNVQAQDAGEYYCVVKNIGGLVESSRVRLTVGVPPVIIQHPASQSVTAGDAVTFMVVAEGSAPLRYQWFKNGEPIDTASTLSTYSIAPVTLQDAGEYACRVSNDFGSVLSYAAALSVSGAPRAAFSYDPQMGQAPLAVSFVDMSLPGASDIQSWHWEFGDGLSSTESSPTHTYTEAGIYSVRLTVTNAEFSNSILMRRAVRVYAGAAADVDGDGLTDSDEAGIYNTDPTSPDSDSDGMDDGWEVGYDLDPLSAADAEDDSDGDSLINFEEYRASSDPLDPDSPRRVFYVSPDGSDTEGNGSFEQPWKTIARALSSVTADAAVPVVVRLAPSVYEEDVNLPEWTMLFGDTATGDVVIRGYVAGSANTSLENLIIRDPLPGEPYPLLTISGGMQVVGVRFEGGAGSAADGIAVSDGVRRGSLIERCEFTALTNGIVVKEAIPLIRRCWFHHLTGSALIVQAVPVKQDDGTLSTAADPNSGYNTIDLETIEGEPAVVNERDEPLIMENNDWNTDDLGVIGANVSEGTDYIPPLAKGSAAGAATANCAMWDATTLQPVTNASVSLSPGSFLPLTANTGGVYTFACLAPGTYTFAVTAPGYNIALKTEVLNAADNVILHFPLTASGNEGEGEGETPGGCFGGITSRLEPPPPVSGNHGGDFAILAAIIVALAAARKKCQPNTR